MTREVLLTTTGSGHEQIHAWDEDGDLGVLQHHRVLSYAWGDLESPFFSEDLREVHHYLGVGWATLEDEIEALTPEEHREVDEGRARIRAPWERSPAVSRGGEA